VTATYEMFEILLNDFRSLHQQTPELARLHDEALRGAVPPQESPFGAYHVPSVVPKAKTMFSKSHGAIEFPLMQGCAVAPPQALQLGFGGVDYRMMMRLHPRGSYSRSGKAAARFLLEGKFDHVHKVMLTLYDLLRRTVKATDKLQLTREVMDTLIFQNRDFAAVIGHVTGAARTNNAVQFLRHLVEWSPSLDPRRRHPGGAGPG